MSTTKHPDGYLLSPAPKSYFTPKHLRYLEHYGHFGPDRVQVRISKGKDWWVLDDMLQMATRGHRHVMSQQGFCTIDRSVLPEAIDMMRVAGHLGRLVVRELPTRIP